MNNEKELQFNELDGKENNPDDLVMYFFKNKGFKNIKRIYPDNFNDIFFATKDGQECFIKKYAEDKSGRNSDFSRAKKEFVCYENLPKDLLIDVLEVNFNEQYLVLKKVELQDIEKNEQSVTEIIELYLGKIIEIDASFLPEIQWEDYEKLFEKLKKLEDNCIIKNACVVIGLFNKNRSLIDEAKKVFSHRDFNLNNIKKLNDRLVVFDFESAGRDNAMSDMATFYIDICDNKNLCKIFVEKIKGDKNYNERLLDLMIIRRCVIILDKFQKQEKASLFFQKNLSIFNEKLNECN